MYAILHDWGSEGLDYYKHGDGSVYEFKSFDEAFKVAMELNYTTSFEIVKRVRYTVEEVGPIELEQHYLGYDRGGVDFSDD